MSINEVLNNTNQFYRENNIYYQKGLDRNTPFEMEYLEVREKEGRLYPDHLAKNLPQIPADHSLNKEWAIRRNSSDQVIGYLAKIRNVKLTLEVGCGNGWLINRLALRLPGEFCGLDVNETELKQAARLFGRPVQVNFLYANVMDLNWDIRFDIILLSSSLQYFPDVSLLINKLLSITSPNGEIHIVDTPFYGDAQAVLTAQKRSREYFQSVAPGKMAGYYFHPAFNRLKEFNVTLMHDPNSWSVRFRRKLLEQRVSPFPWFRIKGR